METVSKSESAKLRELLMELCFTPNSKLKPEHVNSNGVIIPQVGQAYAELSIFQNRVTGKYHCRIHTGIGDHLLCSDEDVVSDNPVIEDTLEMAIYNAMEAADITMVMFFANTGFLYTMRMYPERRRDDEGHLIFRQEPYLCCQCYDVRQAHEYQRSHNIPFNSDAPVGFGE